MQKILFWIRATFVTTTPLKRLTVWDQESNKIGMNHNIEIIFFLLNANFEGSFLKEQNLELANIRKN